MGLYLYVKWTIIVAKETEVEPNNSNKKKYLKIMRHLLTA